MLFRSEKQGGDVVVSWTAGETSTPQIGAKVEIIDEDGKVVATKEMTRPEETSMTLADVAIAEYNCRLTVTDIFGQTAVTEKATDGYALKGEEPSPSEEEEEPTDETESVVSEEESAATSEQGGEEPAQKVGFFEAIGNFFANIFESIAEFFKNLFGGSEE